MNELDRLEDAVKALVTTPVPDEQIADVSGRVRAAERRLADFRLSLLSETVGPVEGDDYKIEEVRTAKRSYNSPGILNAFATRWEKGPFETLVELTQLGVVKLVWGWQKLERELAVNQIELRKVYREIDTDDLDGPLVGEVWETKTRVTGRL